MKKNDQWSFEYTMFLTKKKKITYGDKAFDSETINNDDDRGTNRNIHRLKSQVSTYTHYPVAPHSIFLSTAII